MGKELSKETWCGIGIVIIVAIVVGTIGFLMHKRTKKGGKTKNFGAANGDSGSKSRDFVEIYVGNLSFDMSESQLRKEFERFGVVKSARIISHRTTNKSKGYGFVEMPHRKEAMVAVKALNGRDILGRKLRVNEARNGSRAD